MENTKKIKEFDEARKSYNNELSQLRDKYVEKFKEILLEDCEDEQIKNEDN